MRLPIINPTQGTASALYSLMNYAEVTAIASGLEGADEVVISRASAGLLVQVGTLTADAPAFTSQGGGVSAWFGGGDPAADTTPTGTFVGPDESRINACVGPGSVAVLIDPADHYAAPPTGFTAI